jgi:hypothetical protein
MGSLQALLINTNKDVLYNYHRRRYMELIEAIRARKSVRDFKPDPVPQEVLREIL